MPYSNGDIPYSNGDMPHSNGDMPHSNGDMSHSNGDMPHSKKVLLCWSMFQCRGAPYMSRYNKKLDSCGPYR